MAVTSSSAKVKFYVGDFDVTTTIADFPAATQNNTLSLEFEEFISPQLADWGTPLSLLIYVLFSVDYEGQNIYVNPQFNSFSPTIAPTDPDILITPNADPATSERSDENNFIPLITGTDGELSTGEYTVTARFVYRSNATGNFSSEDGVFTANFSFEEKTPILSNPYNPATPFLTLKDSQSYLIGGVQADRDTEFVLYPPQDGTPVTNLFDNIQQVTYTNFFTGGNNYTYTNLLTYDLSDKVIVNAQQKDGSDTIYDVDSCSLFTCLNNQYELTQSANCGNKVKEQAESALIDATVIAYQITEGLGCANQDLSGLITDFNNTLNCNCNCLNSTPRELGSNAIVTSDERLSVTADSATTDINLAGVSTIAVDVQATTTLNITNIEQFKNYRFVFTTGVGGFGVTFPVSEFEGSAGALLDRFPSTSGTLILDFYSSSATILTLVSDSAA